jgi:hypothetical protein
MSKSIPFPSITGLIFRESEKRNEKRLGETLYQALGSNVSQWAPPFSTELKLGPAIAMGNSWVRRQFGISLGKSGG